MRKISTFLVFLIGFYGFSASYYVPEKIASLEIGDIPIYSSAVYEDVLIILSDKIYTFDISDINSPEKLQEIDTPFSIPEEFTYPSMDLRFHFFDDHFLFYSLDGSEGWTNWKHTYTIYNCSDSRDIYFESIQEVNFYDEDVDIYDYHMPSVIGFNGNYLYHYFYNGISMWIDGFMVVDFSDPSNIQKTLTSKQSVGDGNIFILEDYLVFIDGKLKIYDISDSNTIEYKLTWNNEFLPRFQYIHLGSNLTVKDNNLYSWTYESDKKSCIVNLSSPESPIMMFSETSVHPMDFIVNENLFVGGDWGDYYYSIYTIDNIGLLEQQMVKVGEITGTSIFREYNGYLFAYEDTSLCVYTINQHPTDNQDLITDIEFTPLNRDEFYTKVNVLCEAQINDTDSFEVMSYYWDFDGDGIVDEVTSGNTVEHEFAFAGTYPVTLRLENSEGVFSQPYTEELTIMEDPAPTIPENFRGFFSGDSDINLYWNASIDNDGVKYYAVYRGEDNSLLGTTGDIRYTVNNVSHNEMHRFKLKAFDYYGNASPLSPEAVVIPENYDSEAPSVPQTFVGVGISETEIHLSWEPSTDNIGVRYYAIYRSEDNSLVATTPYTSYVVRGLEQYVTYKYKIKAFDYADNRSAFSKELQTRTQIPDSENPTAPVNLTAAGTSSTDILLRWEPSTDDVGVRFYAVYREHEPEWEGDYPDYELLGTSYTQEFTVSGLEENTTYMFVIKAFDFSGRRSGFSNSVSCQTLKPDNIAPTAPTELTGEVVSATQVNLSWTASTDDQGVRFYAIYEGQSNTLIGTTWMTEYQVENLNANTVYTFKVKAFDFNDNRSPFSNEITIHTPEHVPEGFAFIPSGSFQMGSEDYADTPVHSVTLNAFYLSQFEVTVEEYVEFLNSVPEVDRSWYFQEDNGMPVDVSHIKVENDIYSVVEGYDQYPMIHVSWLGAKAYCDWLSNSQPGIYYLPSEAEWEYACRAGSTTKYYWGDEWNDDYVYQVEYPFHPVGQKIPNDWELYDMAGNAKEWCSDWYFTYAYNNPGGYSGNPSGNPVYSVEIYAKVLRSGSPSADRGAMNPREYTASNGGFRVARTISEDTSPFYVTLNTSYNFLPVSFGYQFLDISLNEQILLYGNDNPTLDDRMSYRGNITKTNSEGTILYSHEAFNEIYRAYFNLGNNHLAILGDYNEGVAIENTEEHYYSYLKVLDIEENTPSELWKYQTPFEHGSFNSTLTSIIFTGKKFIIAENHKGLPIESKETTTDSNASSDEYSWQTNIKQISLNGEIAEDSIIIGENADETRDKFSFHCGMELSDDECLFAGIYVDYNEGDPISTLKYLTCNTQLTQYTLGNIPFELDNPCIARIIDMKRIEFFRWIYLLIEISNTSHTEKQYLALMMSTPEQIINFERFDEEDLRLTGSELGRDNTIFLTGYHEKGDGLVIKLNRDFEEIWRKDYSIDQYTEVFDIHELGSGHLILYGSSYNDDLINYRQDIYKEGFVRTIDSNGNLLN